MRCVFKNVDKNYRQGGGPQTEKKKQKQRGRQLSDGNLEKKR